MVAMNFQEQPSASHRFETEAERAGRVQREAAVIARAEADIDAGLGIDDEDLEVWLDDLDRDEAAPLRAATARFPASTSHGSQGDDGSASRGGA